MSSVPISVKQIEKTPEKIDKAIRMAWHDRTSFETIRKQTGLAESEVIRLMRRQLKPRSFKLWRARVSSRLTKHRTLFERRKRGRHGAEIRS